MGNGPLIPGNNGSSRKKRTLPRSARESGRRRKSLPTATCPPNLIRAPRTHPSLTLDIAELQVLRALALIRLRRRQLVNALPAIVQDHLHHKRSGHVRVHHWSVKGGQANTEPTKRSNQPHQGSPGAEYRFVCRGARGTCVETMYSTPN